MYARSLSRFTHLSPETHAQVLNVKLFDMGWMGMKDTTGVPAAGSFMVSSESLNQDKFCLIFESKKCSCSQSKDAYSAAEGPEEKSCKDNFMS